MLRAKHPKFSAPTKLVLAELDTELPFDKRAMKEMIAKQLIIPVASHGALLRRFEQAGFTPRDYARLYAIPFRRPYRNTKDAETPKLHMRSIHTTEQGAEKQFVFKGTGLRAHHSSFMALKSERLRERRFQGGARIEGIKPTIEILSELEKIYADAKKYGDPVVQWAELDHGIAELPVMKHVAVFRPLQYLKRVEENSLPDRAGTNFVPKGKRTRRVWLTRENLELDELAEFHPSVRVHVYGAREPNRLAELTKPLQNKTKAEYELVAQSGDRMSKIKALEKFIARGVLLLYIAHSKGITLSGHSGSSLSPQNASLQEFFDFDTAEKGPRLYSLDYDNFGNSIIKASQYMGFGDKLGEYGLFSYRTSTVPKIRRLVGKILHDDDLTPAQKKDALRKYVQEIAEETLDAFHFHGPVRF